MGLHDIHLEAGYLWENNSHHHILHHDDEDEVLDDDDKNDEVETNFMVRKLSIRSFYSYKMF